jgi:glutamyl-tRNA reductase
MLSVGVLGINHKTADLPLRESIARGAQSLSGERALFFHHPTILLSTCNRIEIYFSADDLAQAHSDLLAHLRKQIEEPFEHRLYSYFGVDGFFHLCRVAAGLDSAILAETEIQRQVKVAYANSKRLPSSLHYVFQKALKVSKEIRSSLALQRGAPTLYGTLWRLAEWKNQRILLVGYSEINRGLISFLTHKGVKNISLCTRNPMQVWIEGVRVVSRSVLSQWQEYDVIVCASKADDYLIRGEGRENQVIFDLSVPRNVDPKVGALVYNIEEVNRLIEQKGAAHSLEQCEAFIWENVIKLIRIYRLKEREGDQRMRLAGARVP